MTCDEAVALSLGKAPRITDGLECAGHSVVNLVKRSSVQASRRKA